jgi:hypothetical protein
MSRRAAARLESFGFDNVCVYAPGKQDWLAFGLPIEGSLSKAATAGDFGTAGCSDMSTRRQLIGRREKFTDYL